MKPTQPLITAEIESEVQLLKLLIDEKVPAGAIVESATRLTNLLKAEDHRENRPEVYTALRKLIFDAFAMIVERFQAEGGRAARVAEEIAQDIREAEVTVALLTSRSRAA